MKLSFTAKIRFVILLMLVISLIQGVIMLHLIPDNFPKRIDLLNTIYISTFLQIIFAIIIISYIPLFLQKAFNEMHQILKDVSQGIYNIDINLDEYEKTADKEFFAMISSLKDMVKSIIRFDKLKKDKIVEHHNRIQAILNLSENGFIILNKNGDIVYSNDILLDTFPSMLGKNSMIDSNFPPEIENNIKKYAITVLKSGSKKDSQNNFFPSLKKHITLNSAIVRDSAGIFCGAVIALTNLPKIIEQDKN